MGWLEKIFSKGKRPKNANLSMNVTMNGYQPNFTAFGTNILLSDIVYSATAMKARYFGILKPEHIREDLNEIVKIKDSSVSRLLRRPNDFQTLYDFLTQAYFMREKNDNCFIYPDYRIDDNKQKIYTGMYILLPADSPIIMQDESGELYIRFLFLNPDREVVFPYKDIIHWKKNIEDDQFTGGGRFATRANTDLLNSLQAYRTGQEAVAEASKLGCMIDGILKINAYATSDKVKKVREDFVNDLKENKSGIAVLDNGVDYQNIQRTLKVMDSATLQEIKNNVMLHTGVTIDMLSGKMTKEERETFYENHIRPASISLAQAMERVFFSQWQVSHGDKIVMYPTDIELMTSEERYKYCDMFLKAGAITINEARRFAGLPPVADGDQRPRGYNNLDGGKKEKDPWKDNDPWKDPSQSEQEEKSQSHEVNINFRFNDNHDPDTGQFTSGDGGGGSSGSGGSKGSGSSKSDKTAEYKEKMNAELDKINSRISNEVKPFEKEKELNLKEVKERGGVNDEDAKKCGVLAEKVYSEAEAREPQITSDVVSCAEEAGAKMDGLEFRMKQPTSCAGKIASDALEDGVSFEEKANKVTDAVRYTAILDEDNFVDGYNKIKSSMEAKGYKEVTCKNYFAEYEKGTSCQKAVQCKFQDKNGYVFEYQFHTKKSEAVKFSLNHKRYETMRKKTTSSEEKKRLWDEMVDTGKLVSNPKGVLEIQSHK